MTQQEFLIDTLQYYLHDTTRRCKNHSGCSYSPKTIKHENSEGCAIGRHLNDDVKLIFDKSPNSSIEIILSDINLKNQLPEFMKNFDEFFIIKIQKFHDNDSNWGTNKLSEFGKYNLESMINHFNFDKSLFEKYTQ